VEKKRKSEIWSNAHIEGSFDFSGTVYLQNHRVVEIGRGLWRLSGPTALLRQGHLGQVAQDHVQTAFEHLQGWRLHSLPGH